MSVCDKNLVASVAQELKHRISWNFIFSCSLTYVEAYDGLGGTVFRLLEYILEQAISAMQSTWN